MGVRRKIVTRSPPFILLWQSERIPPTRIADPSSRPSRQKQTCKSPPIRWRAFPIEARARCADGYGAETVRALSINCALRPATSTYCSPWRPLISSPALPGNTSLANSNQCLLATAAGFFITGSLRPGLGRVRRHQGARISGLMFREALEKVGAGEGNRTLVFSLEGCCSTIELHPLFLSMIRPENRCSMLAGSPNMPFGLSQLPSPARSLPISARSALNRRRLASYSHLSINNERR